MNTLRIAILGLGLLAASAAGAERAYVKTRAGERPRPAVAIDNVCAWPNLTVFRDGTIIATIFNQPCHGLWEGDVECWEVPTAATPGPFAERPRRMSRAPTG